MCVFNTYYELIIHAYLFRWSRQSITRQFPARRCLTFWHPYRQGQTWRSVLSIFQLKDQIFPETTCAGFRAASDLVVRRRALPCLKYNRRGKSRGSRWRWYPELGRGVMPGCSRAYSAPSRMTISQGTWTPAYSQLCASIVKIQVLYGDNMSKPNIRKITADPTKCNTDSSRRPSVFERLGTKPAIAAAAAAQNTSDYCRNWALNGSCSYGKSCKWAADLIYPE